MHQIFPLSEAACELEERYIDHTATDGTPRLHVLTFNIGYQVIVDQPPKAFEWRDYLKAVIDDYLNQVLHWTAPTKSAGRVLQRILPGFIPPECGDAGYSLESRRRAASLHLDADVREYEKASSMYMQLINVRLPPGDLKKVRAIQRLEYDGGCDPVDIGRLVTDYIDYYPHKMANEALSQQLVRTRQRLDILRDRIELRKTLLEQMNIETHSVEMARVQQEASDKLYEVVLAPMIEKVQSWVDTALHLDDASPTADYQWRTWIIQDVGDDIDIQMGEDFRILDWQRRFGKRNFNRDEASHIQHGRVAR